MKTNHRLCLTGRANGSVLVISLTILAIAALLLGSYLVLVQTQTNSVARSQCWNSALSVTEAGLEDALAEINQNAPVAGSNTIVTHPWSWTNNVAANGWSPIVNRQTSRTNYISGSTAGSNLYVVTIYLTNVNPTIVSAGAVPFTAALWGSYGTSQPFTASVGTATAANYIVGRRIEVQTSLTPLFGVGVLARSNINFNGNNVSIDSFDSTSTQYSSNGQWTASLRKSGGTIATDSGVVGDIGIGNANIYGHIYTGPGTSESAVQVGANGSVGDTNWVAHDSGIESNYWSGNFNTSIPPISPPSVGTGLPSPDTNGNIVLSSSTGNYTVSSASAPTAPLIISGGPVVLWVQGSFSPNNIIFTNGGSLTLFIGTTNASANDALSLGGSGNVNSPGLAANLTILGLPSLTSISMSGNAALIASIYAPEANFSGGGGGNNNNDSAGALVVNSVTLSGHWNFHYDESLAVDGASRGWIAGQWTEIKY